jgi:hypothetical protein
MVAVIVIALGAAIETKRERAAEFELLSPRFLGAPFPVWVSTRTPSAEASSALACNFHSGPVAKVEALPRSNHRSAALSLF